MGKLTVKISKAKNISFMRLSLFYLIFIVQIFFTSPGMYVLQFPDVQESQKMVNERLLSELNVFKPQVPEHLELKKTTLQCLASLEEVKKAYYAYEKQAGISGDRLRESKFAEQEVRNGKWGSIIEKTLGDFIKTYNTVGNKNLKEEFVSLKDSKGTEFDGLYYFFKGTPNGVIPSVIEHFKTVMLYHSILAMKKKESELPKFEILTLDETDFIQKFKKNLILGEPLDLIIRPKEIGKRPTVKINGSPIKVDSLRSNDFKMYFLPPSVGDYALEVMSNDKRLFASFKVVPPSFRFINSASSVSGFVGDEIYVTLDSGYVPKGRNITFSSKVAKVERKGWKLIIKPEREGLFSVQMFDNGKFVDESDFVATVKPEEEVVLMDVSGNSVELSQANKLEAKNTFWQVVDFDMSVTHPNGFSKRTHSSTRFLRNDLRELESSAPTGSVLIFDNIRLVGQTDGVVTKGRPVIIIK